MQLSRLMVKSVKNEMNLSGLFYAGNSHTSSAGPLTDMTTAQPAGRNHRLSGEDIFV